MDQNNIYQINTHKLHSIGMFINFTSSKHLTSIFFEARMDGSLTVANFFKILNVSWKCVVSWQPVWQHCCHDNKEEHDAQLPCQVGQALQEQAPVEQWLQYLIRISMIKSI